MKINLEKKIWWSYLPEDLQGLLRESVILTNNVGKWKEKFDDYAFVVFPAAKAYEGFLKTLFLDLGFISEKVFYGKRFRIGKALNPALKSRFREKISVYDKIVTYCGGSGLADSLWDTWKTCRNLLFHWFPNEKNAITFSQAKMRVKKVIKAFDMAFKECKVK
jgi:hypothetical protein